MSLNLLKDDLTSDPPSVSNVSVNTSVATTSFSRFAAVAATGAPNGTADGLAAIAAGAGTLAAPEAGTDDEAADSAGVVALTAGVAFGKKVGCLPLNVCH